MTEERALQTLDYNDQRVLATLKATVAQGATPAEFAMFTEFCRATGLNPFKREIWFIKAAGRVQLMTGINGFFSIANANPQFDGYESGLIAPDGSLVPGSYPNDDYIGAWARVYRKDRRIPTEGIAMLKEYDKGHGNWKTMKRVMIIKCAESVALRKTFPQELNGLYTAEEMPSNFAPNPLSVEPQPEEGSPTVEAEPVASGEFKYRIPFKEKDTWKPAIKEVGGWFEPETKLWVTPKPIDGLEAYLVNAVPPVEPTIEQVSFDDDDLPANY